MKQKSILVQILLLALFCIVSGFSFIEKTMETSGGALVAAIYNWKEVLPFGNGSFQETWKPGTFPLGIPPVAAFDGNLWMTGQKMSWSSNDGKNWNPHPKKDWGDRISMTYVYFDHKLWMFGGVRYQKRELLNEIWFSDDGINWKQAANAGWQPRKGTTIIDFQDKLWLFGGVTDMSADFKSNKMENDIWSSKDGIHWSKETSAAEWSPREGPRIVVLNGALYMLGAQGKADVWRSRDGKKWDQLNAEAEWKGRNDCGALAFDNKLWIFGGRDNSENHNEGAKNDVWYTADGVQWNLQTGHAPWTVRSAANSVVFKDQIWLFSGKHTGGKSNWGGDVWTLAADK